VPRATAVHRTIPRSRSGRRTNARRRASRGRAASQSRHASPCTAPLTASPFRIDHCCRASRRLQTSVPSSSFRPAHRTAQRRLLREQHSPIEHGSRRFATHRSSAVHEGASTHAGDALAAARYLRSISTSHEHEHLGSSRATTARQLDRTGRLRHGLSERGRVLVHLHSDDSFEAALRCVGSRCVCRASSQSCFVMSGW
jgi:hypothetical protein